MNFTIDRDSLLSTLQAVVGVIAPQQGMPILSNVLISTTDNQNITFIATDSEIEIRNSIQLNSLEEEIDTLTISGRKLFDICRTLPKGVTINFQQLDNDHILLKTPVDKFTLATLPPENFPNIEWEKEEKIAQFSMPQKNLQQLLNSTYFAMAKQDVRYYLNGLTLECKGKTLCATASDGHRLASNIVPTSSSIEAASKIILPYKCVSELLRLLTDSDKALGITIGTNHIRIAFENLIFTSKLVDGAAPNYDRTVQIAGDKKVIVDREEIKQALQRVAILAHEVSRELQVNIDTNILHLKTQTQTQQAEENIAINYQGEPATISLNVNYILDVFSHTSAKNIAITFKDAMSSVILEEAIPESNSLHVVMPLRM